MLMCIVGPSGPSEVSAESHKLMMLPVGSLACTNNRGTGLDAWLPLARNTA